MFKQLIVVFALVASASASLSPEKRMLYMEKAALESVIFSDRDQLAPEKVLIAVNELTKVYSKLSLPEKPAYGERAQRDIVAFLYNIGQLSKDNCEELIEFNKDVDAFIERFANLKDACNFARAYKVKQNQLC